MNVTVNAIDKHNVTLTMTAEASEVTKAVKQAVTNIAKQVNIPGFRKGKAPRKVLEMNFGKDVIIDEAFELLSNRLLMQALVKENLEAVTAPKVERVVFEEGKDAEFTATFVKKPEVTLGEYKGLDVEKKEALVTDEDVEGQLNNIRDQHSKMVVAPEGTKIEKGDLAVIDFLGEIDGVPFAGGEGKSHPLQIGSNTFIPGFEDQLVGKEAGEDVDVNVTFPEDYHVGDLAGKPAVFHVHIHDIKRREVPELNDDFAKEVSAYASMEELTADLRKKLEADANARVQDEYNRALLDLAVANATVDIPEVMIAERIENMIQEMDMRLAANGMNINSFLAMTGKTMDELRNEYRDSAEKNVRTDLVLEAIVKAENIDVTEDDMRFEIIMMAQSFGANPNEVFDIIVKEAADPTQIVDTSDFMYCIVS